MTMIELGVVMAIVTVLLALVLGLSRHVNEIVKVRRAQTELGEWHEVLNTWHLKYGVYPDPMAYPINNPDIESNLVWLASQNANRAYYAEAGGSRIYFSSLMSRRLSPVDPWGTPYFYRSTTNAYELLSCGPNTLHLYQRQPGGPDVRYPRNSQFSMDSGRVNDDDLFFEP